MLTDFQHCFINTHGSEFATKRPIVNTQLAILRTTLCEIFVMK